MEKRTCGTEQYRALTPDTLSRFTPTERARRAAIWAAEQGFKVFPLAPDAKRPMVRDWDHRATDRAAYIGERWPEKATGYGVACGPSGLYVVDCDTPKSDSPPPPPEVADAACGLDALCLLAAEGVVITTTKGTKVAPLSGATTAADRLRLYRGDRPPTDLETVREAGVIPYGERYAYVAGLLGEDDDGHVVRRESLFSQGGRPVELVVTWHPVSLLPAVPELAVPEPIPGGEGALIAQRTKSVIRRGEDFWRARGARDSREADALGVDIGTPILAGAWLWHAESGVVEYGEVCSLADRVIRYEYEITDEPSSVP